MRTGPQRARLPEDPAGKIIPRVAAARLFSRLRREGKRIVFTNGCFDILHAGHARYLLRAAALGDVLVVGLNGDASVRRLKGEGRPVQKESDRAYLLASLSCVSYVVIFREDTPAALVERVAPHVLVKGGDWKGKEIAGADFVRARGGSVRTIPFLAGRSTTSIIRRAARIGGESG
ncbi:MAG: D-glycero-beta-D-manno-heptose 1-phosphate adenylyltransferase [Deltaproteobacteria bacterium]|nr:D-glycero-beta-D-manno-heptose 1-phosphate adenylyltransferase [Deltaproteobacteria bacterium]